MKKCPMCSESEDVILKPFCSKRCADIDLHRWFSGSYALPASEDEGDEMMSPPLRPFDESDQ